jgi:hypothetical protein
MAFLQIQHSFLTKTQNHAPAKQHQKEPVSQVTPSICPVVEFYTTFVLGILLKMNRKDNIATGSASNANLYNFRFHWGSQDRSDKKSPEQPNNFIMDCRIRLLGQNRSKNRSRSIWPRSLILQSIMKLFGLWNSRLM